MPVKLSTRGIKRLEITMRDVLDGLEDAASFINYSSTPDIVEILSIEPPGRPIAKKQNVVQISTSFDHNDSSDIVEYLTERELKKSA